MRVFFTSLVLSLLLFSGCNSQPEHATKAVSDKPSWILNPTQNGRVGAVGVASKTYDQKVSTQRKLAIARALDELTLQKGVKVNLNMEKRELVTNERLTTTVDTKTDYSASSTVTAHIESVYKDYYTGELYIWMVMD